MWKISREGEKKFSRFARLAKNTAKIDVQVLVTFLDVQVEQARAFILRVSVCVHVLAHKKRTQEAHMLVLTQPLTTHILSCTVIRIKKDQ